MGYEDNIQGNSLFININDMHHHHSSLIIIIEHLQDQMWHLENGTSSQFLPELFIDSPFLKLGYGSYSICHQASPRNVTS